MQSKEDVRTLRGVLETLPGIEAYDVLPHKVRLSYDPTRTNVAAIFAAIAEAGEGYDVELD
ncbi:MAG TPA: copper resistance protein CopZ [Fibrobacteria bacterium]|nr:copper resistance protein CopZ [Fibrobacteria bacterium]